MPTLIPDSSTLRGSYAHAGYLSTPDEPVVFSRAVNMAAIGYPLLSVVYDDAYTGAGAYTDVREGMEILVYYGNTSVLKGRLRVAAGAATSTILQINEISRSRLQIADNDRFDVVRSYRVRDKLIGATAVFPKDSRVAYTNQNSIVAPLAHSGGHWAGWLDNGSVTVTMAGSSSQALDPDSAGTLAHSWDAPGATPSTSTSANPDFVYTLAGTYWVTHTVTDSSNSATTIQRVMVRVHDETDTPIPLRISSMTANLTEGWACEFRTLAHSSITQLPDGAMVVYHEREFYNGTPQSFGNRVASRSHIKFVGYLVRNTIRVDSETQELVFSAVSPLAILQQLPGFSQALKAVATATNWQQWKTPLRTNDLLVYLLRWHTTVLDLYDMVLPAYNYAYPEFFVQQQTPAGQVAEIADAVDATLRCDRTGTLVIRQDLRLVGSTARDSAVTTFEVTTADVLDVDLEYLQRTRIAQLTGRAFTTTGAPIQSQSGAAPAEGSEFTSVDRLIVSAQSGTDTALNERTGRRWARDNRQRFFSPAPQITITLPGAYDVFDPAYDEWMLLTFSRVVANRSLTLNQDRFVIESIEVQHEENETRGVNTPYKRVRLTLAPETDGVAGITYVPPQDVGLPSLDFGFDFILPDYSFDAPGADNYGGTLAFFSTNGSIYITRNFDRPSVSGGPDYTEVPLGVGTIHAFVVDAYSPLYLKTGSTVNGWLVAGNATAVIYRVTDIFGTPTLTSRLSFGAVGDGGYTIEASRGTQNYVMAARYTRTVGTIVAYTSNDVTWNTSTVTTAYNTVVNYQGQPGLYVSQRSPTLAYVGAFTSTGFAYAATTGIYKTTDGGATWSLSTSPGTGPTVGHSPLSLHVPYANNPNEKKVYFGGYYGSGELNLYRVESNGTTITWVTAPSTGVSNRGPGYYYGVRTSDSDERYLAFLGLRDTGLVVYTPGLYRSRDGGVTIEEILPINTTPQYTSIRIGGDTSQIVYLLGVGAIAYSGDFLDTIDDRLGSLTGLGGLGLFINVVGG